MQDFQTAFSNCGIESGRGFFKISSGALNVIGLARNPDALLVICETSDKVGRVRRVGFSILDDLLPSIT